MNGQEGQIRVGLDRGWAFDPEPVKEFVAMATAEGFRPSSIDQGRGVPVRYDQFLNEKFGVVLNTAGWKEFATYKGHIAKTGIARKTVRRYISDIIAYYQVMTQATHDHQLLELLTK